MTAESNYLDAIEALEEDNRELALEHARKAVKIDPEHVDAWRVISDASLPGLRSQPTLKQAAQSLTAAKKVVALQPDDLGMWVRGGRLLSDELGLYMEALQWWQDARHQAPDEVTPIVEQAAILADMGLYGEATERLQSIFDENMDLATTQYSRVARLHQMCQLASQQDPKEHFKPWEKHHDGWSAITLRMNKAPISESKIFLIISTPLLMLEVLMAPQVFGPGFGGFCLTSLLILFTVILGMRISRRWFQRLNRPAFNLLRAMDFETSTGYVVIPEEIRISKLFMFILSRRPPAFQERMLKIVDAGDKLKGDWKPTLPDFNSHISEDEEPFWNQEEEELTSFEEE